MKNKAGKFIFIGIVFSYLPMIVLAAGEPRVEYFRAVPESAAYVGDSDNDGAPDFLVNRAVEFELLVCDTESAAVAGQVILGDGTSRPLSSIPCDPLKFPYSYKQPQQDLIAILDVQNEFGRTTVSALKLDIVAEPPEPTGVQMAETQSLEPPVLGPLTQVGATAPQAPANKAANQPAITKNLLPKDESSTSSETKSNETIVQSAQSSTTTNGSPLVGALITGALALIFLVIFVSLLRATFLK